MRRIILTGLLLAITAAELSAAGSYPAIRTDHPRLFFNADSWPEIEARAKGPAKAYLESLLKQVDGYPDNPVATGTEALTKKSGKQANGSYYSLADSPIASIKEFGFQSAQTALAWRFTLEDKYLEKAKKMILASIKGYDTATENLRPVSWYSTSRILTLCAYDWIYEALTPDERRSMIVPLVKHVARVQPDGGPKIPRQPASNPVGEGFYGVASLLWYCGVAAYGDGFCDELARSQMEKGYDRYMKLMNYRDQCAGDDGGLVSMTLAYVIGAYPWAHFNFMHTLRSACGIDLSSEYMGISYLPNWIWWTWIRDDYCGGIRNAGIGDCKHSQNVEDAANAYEHLTQFINFYRDSNPDVSRLSAAIREYLPVKRLDLNFPIYPFILDDRTPGDRMPLDELVNHSLKARHFETLGEFQMRSGWSSDDTYCTFIAGTQNMRQHRHFDENSFTIYKYDHLALDTGCRARQSDLNLKYYYSQSVAHNVVLIHKPDEPLPDHWGPNCDDPEGKTNYGGMYENIYAKVLAFETGEHFSYIASDATACYKEKCTESVRQFVYVHPDWFIVYDRETAADASYSKEWLLHSQNEPVIKGNLSRIDASEGRLFCQTLLPANAKIVAEGGEGREFWSNGRNWEISPGAFTTYRIDARKSGRGPYTGAWRIEVHPRKAALEDRFLHVLTATDINESRPVSAEYVKNDTQDGVKLTLPEGKVLTFMFNRNGVVGGTVTIDGETRPLSDNIQPQSGIITSL